MIKFTIDKYDKHLVTNWGWNYTEMMILTSSFCLFKLGLNHMMWSASFDLNMQLFHGKPTSNALSLLILTKVVSSLTTLFLHLTFIINYPDYSVLQTVSWKQNRYWLHWLCCFARLHIKVHLLLPILIFESTWFNN